MPYKVGELYCARAQEDGKVQEVTDKRVTVQYKSGKVQSFPLGDTYGRMEGSVYKHTIVPHVKTGQIVKAQDPVTYNTGFFEKDWLDPSRLIMKFGKTVTVALTMSDETFEDSSAVSERLGNEMAVPYIKEKIFVIEFAKNIIDIKEQGTSVGVQDTLFTVIDENTDYANLSESSVALLKTLSNISPKAKMRGTVFRYEVKYNGDISDMSHTLRKLCNQLDKELHESTKNTDREVKTNRVTGEYRSQGKNLMPNTLELKVFIEATIPQGNSDKLVLSNQLKSVSVGSMSSKVTTESGAVVDVMFSYRSILNRVTLSPLLIGTTVRLLRHLTPKVADAYFG